MALLPKSRKEFREKEYWDSFFTKRGRKAFEWYGEYAQLCGHLHKYIKTQDMILNVGCGNSKICMDLYDVGCKYITNIDTSSVVIRQMTDINRSQRSDMKFMIADATNMKKFRDGQFSVVLDKGTLDAICCDGSDETIAITQQYWSEIDRVLRIGGRYVVVSLLQEHIINELLVRFAHNSWMVRVIRCMDAERGPDGEPSDTVRMPVFMVVCTKMQRLPMLVVELCTVGDKIVRCKEPEEILKEVSALQRTASVMNGLRTHLIVETGEIDFFFYTGLNDDEPKYRTYTLDEAPRSDQQPYAAFLIPQGRESEWMFGTPKGRKEFHSKYLAYNRVTYIMLSRAYEYTTWNDISDELHEALGRFAPGKAVTKTYPFVTLGNDVGTREVIYKGKSELSGEYIVEDVKGEANETFRRLIFLNNQFIIQSEAQLKIEKLEDGTIKKSINPMYLACEHHRYMTLGVNAIRSLTKMKSKKNISALIIGLGGGGLATHIHRVTNTINMTVIEIDPEISTVAKDHFELVEDDRLTIVIDDGLEYLLKSAVERKIFKSILFDVDSKDSSIGISCPPPAFVTRGMLETVKQCLVANGIFILNIVCRDEKIRAEVKKDLNAEFSTIHSYKMDEDINEVLFCMNMDIDKKRWSDAMEASAKKLYGKTGADDAENVVDLDDLLQKLKI